MAYGRSINTAKLVFVEEAATVPAGQRPKTVTIEIDGDDITQDRVLKIADVDGYLTGLAPGQGWPISKGGTGLVSLNRNQLVAGSGTDTMYAVPAPTAHGDGLFYDQVVGNQLRFAPWDLSGIENTTARNLTTTLGVYSSKLGTELRFKGLAPSGLVTITDNGTALTIGVDATNITVLPSQITGNIDLTNKVTGILPVANGGTGLTSTSPNALLVGAAGNTYTSIPAPTSPGQYLRSNAGGTLPSWQNVTLTESFTGEIVGPIARTYNLSNNWGYNAQIQDVTVKTLTGTTNFSVFAANRIAGTGTATTTKQTFSVGGVNLNTGDDFTLTLSGLAGCQGISFTINLTRV